MTEYLLGTVGRHLIEILTEFAKFLQQCFEGISADVSLFSETGHGSIVEMDQFRSLECSIGHIAHEIEILKVGEG